MMLNCDARPNTGFTFSAWSGDLASFNSNNNPVIQFPVTRYGKLTAIFIQQTPVTLPPQFWTPLYGLIPGFFIPSIIRWLNNRRQRGHLNKQVDLIELDHPELKNINKEIEKLYINGKLSDSHYRLLKEKLSEHYKDDTNT
jgi:hypothetical protein